MSSRFKYIFIVLLTIVMIIGIKFGKVDDEYFVDLQVNKYYSEIWEYIISSEKLAEKKDFTELQGEILEARNLISSFQNYVKDNYTEEYRQDIVNWSVRLDSVQQIILDEVSRNVNKATALKTQKDIDYAKNSIPENLPDKFKNGIIDTLDNIIVYDNLNDEIYLKAEKVFDSIEETSRKKELEIDLVQKSINSSRKLLEELIEYIYSNEITFYKEEVNQWSVRLDNIQQILINRVSELVNTAEVNKNKDEIQKIKTLISDMPEKFSKDFIDRLNKIDVVN